MPYDSELAERLEDVLKGRPGFQQKKMFGGIGWMLNGNMCVGIYEDWLITRVGESAGTKLFKEKHTKPMDITGTRRKPRRCIQSSPERKRRKLPGHFCCSRRPHHRTD